MMYMQIAHAKKKVLCSVWVDGFSLSLSFASFFSPFIRSTTWEGVRCVFYCILFCILRESMNIINFFTWIPTTPSPIANRVCSKLKKHIWDCTGRLHAIFSLSTKQHYQKSRRRSFPHAFIFFKFSIQFNHFRVRDTRIDINFQIEEQNACFFIKYH